jgi:hypothetical protein
VSNKSEQSNFYTSEVDEQIDSIEYKNSNIDKVETKNEQARELMINSAELIFEANSAIDIAKNSISQNVNRFEKIKNDLLNSTIIKSKSLLEKTSYEYSIQESDEPFEISLGTTSDDIRVQDISSGAFSGLILSLLTLISVVGTWFYFASIELGFELTPSIINNQEEQNRVFEWIAGLIGIDVDPRAGVVIIAVTALFLAWVVYKLRVSTKESKNFKVANETFEKSNIYAQEQEEARVDMEQIDEHIVNIIPVVENYKVLLDEQNAKLQRVLHIEGIKDEYNQYHTSSIDSMKESELLMDRVKRLVTTPVTKNGRLNDNSLLALSEAKSVYEYFISKIYA